MYNDNHSRITSWQSFLRIIKKNLFALSATQNSPQGLNALAVYPKPKLTEEGFHMCHGYGQSYYVLQRGSTEVNNRTTTLLFTTSGEEDKSQLLQYDQNEKHIPSTNTAM